MSPNEGKQDSMMMLRRRATPEEMAEGERQMKTRGSGFDKKDFLGSLDEEKKALVPTEEGAKVSPPGSTTTKPVLLKPATPQPATGLAPASTPATEGGRSQRKEEEKSRCRRHYHHQSRCVHSPNNRGCTPHMSLSPHPIMLGT